MRPMELLARSSRRRGNCPMRATPFSPPRFPLSGTELDRPGILLPRVTAAREHVRPSEYVWEVSKHPQRRRCHVFPPDFS